jgi:flagellin
MRIMNNISSLNAWRNLSQTENNMSKNLERLSSGYRINSASDDVAGLAISENMRAQIRGLNQAVKNAQDGNSMLQTAEGSLNEVHSMLQRMRELAVQAANGTLQPADRSQIQTEMDNLATETTRITNATQFNSKDLIDGSLQNGNVTSVTLQIGPNGGQTLNFAVGAMDAKSLGISRDVMTASVYNDNGFLTESVLGGTFVSSVAGTGAVGPGIQAGEYRVHFDSTTSTVQLQDSAGTAVGAAVAAVGGGKVTIGDANSAQTLTLTLAAGLPVVTTDDKVMFGSRTAAVSTAAGMQVNIDTTGIGTGVSAVGWGMKDNTDYKVTAIAPFSYQLQDAGGTAIGGVVTAGAAGNTIQVGDATTGRTLDFKVLMAMGPFTDTVHVTNNGEGAEGAKFSGGQKFANSQAFAGLNVSSVAGAQAALASIDVAIQTVSSQRSQMGAIQNRLDHTVSNLQVVSENLTASESRIRDVDMAQEMSSFSKNQILSQSGTAMLAQANQKNQGVLQLLR